MQVTVDVHNDALAWLTFAVACLAACATTGAVFVALMPAMITRRRRPRISVFASVVQSCRRVDSGPQGEQLTFTIGNAAGKDSARQVEATVTMWDPATRLLLAEDEFRHFGPVVPTTLPAGASRHSVLFSFLGLSSSTPTVLLRNGAEELTIEGAATIRCAVQVAGDNFDAAIFEADLHVYAADGFVHAVWRTPFVESNRTGMSMPAVLSEDPQGSPRSTRP